MKPRELRACNVLMIYPRFAADTFWNFAATCELFGAKYPAAPLGLITVLLNTSNRKRQTRASDSRHGFSSSDMVHRIIGNLPEPREIFWPAFKKCMSSNPQSARWVVALTALYLHLGPFSRYVVGLIEQKIDDLPTRNFDARREGSLSVAQTPEFQVAYNDVK